MTMSDSRSLLSPVSRRVVPARHFLLFSVLAGIGCWLDLATKRWVFQWRGMPGEQPIWWLWDGFFGVETSLNTGALFGLGHNRVLWFAGLSAVAFLGLILWFVFGRAGQSRSMTVVLGCVAGGILGNLYDRLGLWSIGPAGEPAIYAVRDWIRVSYGQYVWPNFNIADSLLVGSAAWLIWCSFRHPHELSAEQSAGRRAEKSPSTRA